LTVATSSGWRELNNPWRRDRTEKPGASLLQIRSPTHVSHGRLSMCFFLYRDNYVVKMGEGDEQLKEKLESQGYELFSRPLPTREAAASEQQVWQENINTRREQGLF